jgi:hypothetical protein
MKDLNSDTFRCRFVIDKWDPEVEYRVLKKVAIGKWFGVFTIYKYYWSNWIGESIAYLAYDQAELDLKPELSDEQKRLAAIAIKQREVHGIGGEE